MEKSRILNSCSIGLVFATIFIVVECRPDDPEPSADCAAPSDWFPHTQTPAPDDRADFASNCDFHLWSWQSFLWLTQRMSDGELRFETLARPYYLMVDVEGQPPPFSSAAASSLKLMPRVAKSDDPTMFDEIAQAGSLGMLIDQISRT